MSLNLTAKYRPQRFAEVVGQDAVRAVLSRASAENRVAPAYLFSGTRGVGKTTLARILAKALNCHTAPTAEPCGQCPACRQIAAGAFVDVVEIDAASHTGVDDVRSLKEDIGFAPMEGRYKVFIVDEAHMLSKSAFNALLKTLEEPPGHAAFVLATTEPHKIPATIHSRCQHFTFKRVAQKVIEGHLARVLEQEGRGFEPAAASLIARRGAGSVRDAMSLLAQSLALGTETLRAEDVRGILGLAGQEVFFAVLEAIHAGDVVALTRTLAEVLDQGLDLGFFVRELAACFRTMFLLRQGGPAAAEVLDLPAEEVESWTAWSQAFAPAHIHGCWQMVLEGQRRVLTSLEPALALELLLYNLACLPRLLPLERLATTGTPPPRGSGERTPGRDSRGAAPDSGGAKDSPRTVAVSDKARGQKVGTPPVPPAQPPTTEMANPQNSGAAEQEAAPQPTKARPEATPGAPAQAHKTAPARVTPAQPEVRAEASADTPPWDPEPAPSHQRVEGGTVDGSTAATPSQPTGPRSWEGFLDHVAAHTKTSAPAIVGLGQVKGSYGQGALRLECLAEQHCQLLTRGEGGAALEARAREYFGPEVVVTVQTRSRAADKPLKDLHQDVKEHPVVNDLLTEFQAQIVKISRT